MKRQFCTVTRLLVYVIRLLAQHRLEVLSGQSFDNRWNVDWLGAESKSLSKFLRGGFELLLTVGMHDSGVLIGLQLATNLGSEDNAHTQIDFVVLLFSSGPHDFTSFCYLATVQMFHPSLLRTARNPIETMFGGRHQGIIFDDVYIASLCFYKSAEFIQRFPTVYELEQSFASFNFRFAFPLL